VEIVDPIAEWEDLPFTYIRKNDVVQVNPII